MSSGGSSCAPPSSSATAASGVANNALAQRPGGICAAECKFVYGTGSYRFVLQKDSIARSSSSTLSSLSAPADHAVTDTEEATPPGAVRITGTVVVGSNGTTCVITNGVLSALELRYRLDCLSTGCPLWQVEASRCSLVEYSGEYFSLRTRSQQDGKGAPCSVLFTGVDGARSLIGRDGPDAVAERSGVNKRPAGDISCGAGARLAELFLTSARKESMRQFLTMREYDEERKGYLSLKRGGVPKVVEILEDKLPAIVEKEKEHTRPNAGKELWVYRLTRWGEILKKEVEREQAEAENSAKRARSGR
ncbi:unnamed protein product [Amoebophrya sp. A120]|nr:unnamed protein product [Amoebophrya sp. A120]|eukprot:GSA120T00011503001.1